MAFAHCPLFILETRHETISVGFLEGEMETTSLMSQDCLCNMYLLGDAKTCEILTAKVHAQIHCRNLGITLLRWTASKNSYFHCCDQDLKLATIF